jgi:uncharacterized protein with HEPN domain
MIIRERELTTRRMVQSQPIITWKLYRILRDRIIQDIFYINSKRILQLQRTLEEAL